ncbi:MAG: BMP family ABC transporter substrate-binding protein [Synergistaceae bacterium]|nr:BMP family ABC transporter substrate-binding protein [Synergistaceae bacterium]
MRKIIFTAFFLLFAAIAGIYKIQNSQVDTDVTAKTTRVGVLMNGIRFDHSYCQAHYEAIEAIRGELNLDVIYLENVPMDCYPDIENLVNNKGCKIVIGVSYEFGRDMMKAAAKYPDIYFLHASGVGHRNNFLSFFGRMYQARYLSGIAAGMNTKTGVLGYVAAFPISEVVRGINAFALGVRSVRPDAVVYVRYCGSWVDDEAAREASIRLFDFHPVDVVAMHTNSLQPHKEADARGIWSVGYNLDNAALFPKTYLTACVWKYDLYYRKQILNCLQGKFHGHHDLIDMNEGIVALSELSSHADSQTKAKVQAAYEKLRTLEFDVFYGPIRDNTGRLRVDEGESMPDNEMFNNFHWYVEGVKIEE